MSKIQGLVQIALCRTTAKWQPVPSNHAYVDAYISYDSWVPSLSDPGEAVLIVDGIVGGVTTKLDKVPF